MEAPTESESPYGGISNDYFVVKLYQMIGEEPKEILSWDPEGGIIIDRDKLPLSKYFRHSNFTSFQRQLNNFGFHKKRSLAQRKRAAYLHPELRGKDPQAILRLRRISSSKDSNPRERDPLYYNSQPSSYEYDDSDEYDHEHSLLPPPALTKHAEFTTMNTTTTSSLGGIPQTKCILSTLADVATSALMTHNRQISPRPVLISSKEEPSLPRPVSMESAPALHQSMNNESPPSSPNIEYNQSNQDMHPSLNNRRAFPCILRDLIDESPDAVVRWSLDGTLFLVVDPDTLSSHILPKYFRHSRLASFQRQLSLYHFRRVRLSDVGGSALLLDFNHNLEKSTKILAYRHPLFLRGKSDQELRSLTRSGGSRPRPSYLDFSHPQPSAAHEHSPSISAMRGGRNKPASLVEFDHYDHDLKSEDDDSASSKRMLTDKEGLRPRRAIKRPRTGGDDLYY